VLLPYPGTARLLKSGYHPLLSIVLLAPKSLSGGFRGSSRRCGGGLAKQVSGDAENGEASTIHRERLEVRFDEKLDGLFAGVDLDTDSLAAEVDLVASSVLSSNDGVRHWGLALGDRRQHYVAFDRSRPEADGGVSIQG